MNELPKKLNGTLYLNSKGYSRLLLLEESEVVHFIQAGIKRIKVEIGDTVAHLAFQNSKTLGLYLMFGSSLMKLHLKHGGKDSGVISVSVMSDDTVLQFQTCVELEEVLAQEEEAKKHYNRLTDGKKRGVIHWISSAKSVDTRVKRALKLAEQLNSGEFQAKTKSK